MKNSSVFEVKFYDQTVNDKGKKTSDCPSEKQNVVASDAELAIKKLRTDRVGQAFDWVGDDGKKHITKTVAVKILGVEHVCGIDLA